MTDRSSDMRFGVVLGGVPGSVLACFLGMGRRASPGRRGPTPGRVRFVGTGGGWERPRIRGRRSRTPIFLPGKEADGGRGRSPPRSCSEPRHEWLPGVGMACVRRRGGKENGPERVRPGRFVAGEAYRVLARLGSAWTTVSTSSEGACCCPWSSACFLIVWTMTSSHIVVLALRPDEPDIQVIFDVRPQ